MKYFAVFLKMFDEAKSLQYRPEHLAYLDEQRSKGNLFASGRFVDGAGGLVIYKGNSLEEIREIAEKDPYIIQGARTLEIHEWDAHIA